jgi:prepilin-type N-terminal cleavage/methylation domain-containing protein
MEIKHSNKGFTLLETLIAVSVMATIGSLIAQVFFTTTRTNTKTEALKEVKQNGDFALDVMTRMVRNSLSVSSSCASTGTTLGALDIQNSDGDTTEFGCYYDDANKITRIASTSAATGTTEYLTSINTTLGGASCADANNSLSFVCTSFPGDPDHIVITFRLAQRGVSIDQFEKANMQFQTTVSARN